MDDKAELRAKAALYHDLLAEAWDHLRPQDAARLAEGLWGRGWRRDSGA